MNPGPMLSPLSLILLTLTHLATAHPHWLEEDSTGALILNGKAFPIEWRYLTNQYQVQPWPEDSSPWIGIILQNWESTTQAWISGEGKTWRYHSVSGCVGGGSISSPAPGLVMSSGREDLILLPSLESTLKPGMP